jgi:hypothetical protein
MLQHSDPLYAAVSMTRTDKNFGIVTPCRANN